MNEAETSGVASSRPDGLRVVEVDPASDGRWDAFVATHPEALVYHHSSWLQALAHEYPQQVMTLLCEDVGGRTHGILPLIQTRGLPLKLTRGGHMTGRRLSSLPRTPVAGPVASSAAAAGKLLDAAIERARAAESQLEIKTETEELDGLARGLVRTPWRLTYTLNLPSANEELRSRIKSIAGSEASRKLLALERGQFSVHVGGRPCAGAVTGCVHVPHISSDGGDGSKLVTQKSE